MQSNTTGHSMEIFSYIFLATILLPCLISIISMSKKIESLQETCLRMNSRMRDVIDIQSADIERMGREVERLGKRTEKFYEFIKNDNERSVQVILERLEAAKPIKTNNWDSVKQAFKGPVRIEVHERN